MPSGVYERKQKKFYKNGHPSERIKNSSGIERYDFLNKYRTNRAYIALLLKIPVAELSEEVYQLQLELLLLKRALKYIPRNFKKKERCKNGHLLTRDNLCGSGCIICSKNNFKKKLEDTSFKEIRAKAHKQFREVNKEVYYEKYVKKCQLKKAS